VRQSHHSEKKNKDRSGEVRTRLEMRKPDKQIYERNKNWLEHLQRISSERARKPILYYQPIRKRDPSRPRSRRPVPYRQNELTSSSIPDDDDDESKSCM
jgi:hypothetical protein